MLQKSLQVTEIRDETWNSASKYTIIESSNAHRPEFLKD